MMHLAAALGRYLGRRAAIARIVADRVAVGGLITKLLVIPTTIILLTLVTVGS
jgi:hypothetical protein